MYHVVHGLKLRELVACYLTERQVGLSQEDALTHEAAVLHLPTHL